MHLPFPEGMRVECTNVPLNEIQLGSLYLDGPGDYQKNQGVSMRFDVSLPKVTSVQP